MLAAAVATPIVGRLGDLRGQRRIYLIGLVVAGLFSILTAFAWNAASLITARTLSQLGAATTVPSTYAMFFQTLPPERRLRAASMASGVLAGSAVIGLIIGGPLIDLFGWRPIFMIQAGLSGLAFVAAIMVLRRDQAPTAPKPVDYPGALALALATFSLTFAINRLAVVGMTPLVIGAIVLFPVSLTALIVIERRTTYPLLPFHVLRSRNARVVMGVSFLTGAGWMGSFVSTPLMLQSGFGYSTGTTSLITAPRGTAVFTASGFASRLGTRFGVRRVTLISISSLTAVMLIMAFGTHIRSIPMIVIGLTLTGLLFGIMSPGVVTVIANAVPEADIGLAASLQQTTNQIGSVVGIGLCTAIAANSTRTGPYVVVYLLSGAMMLIASFCWIAVRETRRGAPTPDDASSAEPILTQPAQNQPAPIESASVS
jgi:MFS family permease